MLRVILSRKSPLHKRALHFFPTSRSCSYLSLNNADDYCINLVKTHDYENYLIGLLVPPEKRGVYYAIRAFNIEIATIRDQVPSQSMQAGEINNYKNNIYKS